MADAPRGANGAQMTRLDHSFTALPRERASGGAPAVLYGGGITLAALALALSWSTMRPGPRRREPHLPAPAWQANRRRWR